jgi:hypothetical protein
MTVQQACEAANINSNQLWLSLGVQKQVTASQDRGKY